MFERPHHQRIAQVLTSLDGALLRAHHCWFGGGTAIALRHGEYRESVDIDFLVSDLACYRGLRHLLTGPQGIATLACNAPAWEQPREVRADQYGIRAVLVAGQVRIKFEIVLEGRMELAIPGGNDGICGVATLTALDLLASKLLANSDRWGSAACRPWPSVCRRPLCGSGCGRWHAFCPDRSIAPGSKRRHRRSETFTGPGHHTAMC